VTNVDKTILSGDSMLEGGRDILLTRSLGCHLIPPEITERIRWIIEEAVASGLTIPVRRENGGFWIDAEFDCEPSNPEIMIAPVTNSSGTMPRAVAVFEEARPAAEVELGPGLPPAPSGVDGGGPMQPESDRADLEMSGEAVVARSRPIPLTPTHDEVDSHNLTHLPYRNWCSYCVRGRGREDRHSASKKKYSILKVKMDYFFMKLLKDESIATVLSVVDQDSGAPWPTLVDQKGPFAMYATSRVLAGLDFFGRTEVLLVIDGEPAIKALADAVRILRDHKTLVEVVPRYSSASKGIGETINGLIEGDVRVMCLRLHDMLDVTINAEHPALG
jgi:hypothetical protein